jgi:hypothetical protein
MFRHPSTGAKRSTGALSRYREDPSVRPVTVASATIRDE